MRFFLTGLVFLCLSGLVYAQQEVTAALKAEVKTEARGHLEPLTLEQYQQCQARTQQSEQKALQLQKQQTELEQLKQRISELTQQRDKLGQALDLHDLKSVEQYNSVNQKLNETVDIYAQEAGAYNRAVKEYNQEVAALKQECDGRPYIQK